MKKYVFFVSQPYSFQVLRPIQKEIRNRGDEVKWFFDGPGKEFCESNELILPTIESVMRYQPRAIFIPGNRVFDFFPGTKVAVFHGFNVHKRNDKKGHFRIRGLFDLYCTQGPATTKKFKELEQKYSFFKVKETGWPKMDPYFPNKTSLPHSKPTVLYTSTFTESITSTPFLFSEIKRLIQTRDWHWLITFHPRMNSETVEKYKKLQSENCKFVETAHIAPLLQQADVMVSDTSSIISEFLVLHKPVITFRNRKPETHLLDISQPEKLEPAILQAFQPSDKWMQNIHDYADFIHPYRDGNSAKRVLNAVEYFIENEKGKLKRKPWNLLRKLKMRKRVRYYPFGKKIKIASHQ